MTELSILKTIAQFKLAWQKRRCTLQSSSDFIRRKFLRYQVKF